MKEMSLKQRLLNYLERFGGWVNSGEMQKLTMLHMKQTGKTASRRLQELYREGMIERELRRGSAWYRYKTPSVGQNLPPRSDLAVRSREYYIKLGQEAVREFDAV